MVSDFVVFKIGKMTGRRYYVLKGHFSLEVNWQSHFLKVPASRKTSWMHSLRAKILTLPPHPAPQR